MIRLAILYATLFFLPTLAALGQKRAPVAITQRGINEMAASVEQARRALLDEAGLRRPGEDLSAYLRRIALPLPGETRARYSARIGGYLTLLAQSAEATQSGRRMPGLRDDDPANRAQWERTVRALQTLPLRVDKTQAVWRHVQAGYDKPDKPGATSAPVLYAFDVQLEQTAQTIIAASDGLRDARP